jgi:hypothetical protein
VGLHEAAVVDAVVGPFCADAAVGFLEDDGVDEFRGDAGFG